MTQAEQFLRRVESYLKRTGLPAHSLGMLALKDPSFVRQLRAGRQPRLKTVDTVLAYMRDNPRKAKQGRAA